MIRPEIQRYIDSAFPGAHARPLAGDASTRVFLRLRLRDGSTRVLMDYGSPFREETDDIRLRRLFMEASLPVAALHSSVPDPGCLVLDDLGDMTLERALSEFPGERDRLYGSAVELAVAIAVRGTSVLENSERAGGPALDGPRFRYEMDFFLEHYALGLMGKASLPGDLPDLLHALADDAARSPRPVFCHRDFHSRNLMVLEDRTLAMVDIQDARWGPDTYDLASLLRDPYVDVNDDQVDRMVDAYRRSLPHPEEAAAFRSRFEVVGAQRMIKALGTFGYQVGSLGRPRYQEPIPRTLDRLRRVLPSHPATVRLARSLNEAGLLSPPSAPAHSLE